MAKKLNKKQELIAALEAKRASILGTKENLQQALRGGTTSKPSAQNASPATAPPSEPGQAPPSRSARNQQAKPLHDDPVVAALEQADAVAYTETALPQRDPAELSQQSRQALSKLSPAVRQAMQRLRSVKAYQGKLTSLRNYRPALPAGVNKKTVAPVLIGLGGALLVVSLLSRRKKQQQQRQKEEQALLTSAPKPAAALLILKSLLAISQPALKHLVTQRVKKSLGTR